MHTADAKHRQKPLFLAWYVVPAIAFVSTTAIYFGPYLHRQSIIRSLEARGFKVTYETGNHSTAWAKLVRQIPGLGQFKVPVRAVEVTIHNEQEAAALPQLLRDIRVTQGALLIDLTGSDDLARDMDRLTTHYVESVSVSGRELTAAALKSLAKAPTLRVLTLNDCQFGRQAFAEIGRTKYLRTLQLDGSLIRDEDLTKLYSLSSLNELSLSNTHVSESAKEELQCALPHLTLTDD